MKTSDDRFCDGHIVTFACFVIFLVVFGLQYTFGLYLKPILAEFGWSRAAVSGAYSLSWLLQGPSSLLMGKLNDRYGPRLVLTLCGVLLFSGIVLTTRITAAWQLYLFYGVFFGIGTGGTYVPMVSTIARWFTAKRNLMTGLAISGMGFGTFLFSPIANHLIARYNWKISYLILGGVLLFVTLTSAQFLKLGPNRPDRRASDADTAPGDSTMTAGGYSHNLKDAALTARFRIVFAMFFCFGFCLMAVIAHIAPFATDIGISTACAAGLVSAIGISSIAGKILFGLLGDRIGEKKIYIICFCITFASLFIPLSCTPILFLYVFAVLFGLAYGGNACSQSPLAASLFGLESHGAIMGALNIGFTLGATAGPAVSGYLFDLKGNYTVAFVVIQAAAAAGCLLALMLPCKVSAKLQIAAKKM